MNRTTARIIDLLLIAALFAAVVAVVCHVASGQVVVEVDRHPRLMQAYGIRAVDGDTIHVAMIHMAYGVTLNGQSVRIIDLDCWETRRGRGGIFYHEDEIAKGIAARAYAMKLLAEAEAVIIWPPLGRDRDNFGRLLAQVFLIDKEGTRRNFSDLMKAAGHDRTEHQRNAERPQTRGTTDGARRLHVIRQAS